MLNRNVIEGLERGVRCYVCHCEIDITDRYREDPCCGSEECCSVVDEVKSRELLIDEDHMILEISMKES